MRRYIGTFHKSGTVLFESILKQAQAQQVLAPWFLHEGAAPARWDVAFDYHTTTLLDTFERDAAKARYVMCIRDPRDLIVSAAYYHCVSDEPWLQKPMRAFDGATYQKTIKSLPDMQERFVFEMENASGRQIEAMLQIPFGARSLYLTRLETLVQDKELWEFRKMYEFLDFDPQRVDALLEISHDNSLFSGKVERPTHVRSGQVRQYESEFSEATLKTFYALFGNAATALGYDP